MAICQDQPEPRALLGLARVAAAQGMPQDASNFAQGALDLDPSCEPARELLEALAAAGAPA
jgi:cytochrome c-type biogenesis protein CcmH/NrfG